MVPPLSSSTERAIFWLSLIHSLRWKITGSKRALPSSTVVELLTAGAEQ